MGKVRRSRFIFFSLEQFEARDGSPQTLVVLTSALTGQHLLVSAEEQELLQKVHVEEWVDADLLRQAGLPPGRIDEWIALGVFLSDSEDNEASKLRLREELLESSHWPPCAALFHLLNHHHESRRVPPGAVIDTVLLEHEAEQRAEKFLSIHGAPPAAFVKSGNAIDLMELPLATPGSELTEILLRRRTCRFFDSAYVLPLVSLSHLLRLTFGPCALRELLSGALQLLLKTSPSGGSLHPIEAYPLVFSGEGLAPGVYHYQPQNHSLELLFEVDGEVLRSSAAFFAQGQSFVGTPSALIILVARFDRNFWKYRERENSYAVVLQDAGHLSQTFQLLATEQDLGTFYTAAINSEAIVEFLKLRYPAEAPIGLLGVGKASLEQPGEIRPIVFDPAAYRR